MIMIIIIMIIFHMNFGYLSKIRCIFNIHNPQNKSASREVLHAA